jgi:hypothetical protein
MYSRQLEQLARQRPGELAATTRRARRIPSQASAAASGSQSRKVLRSQTGWALVALGLRIAESGRR